MRCSVWGFTGYTDSALDGTLAEPAECFAGERKDFGGKFRSPRRIIFVHRCEPHEANPLIHLIFIKELTRTIQPGKLAQCLGIDAFVEERDGNVGKFLPRELTEPNLAATFRRSTGFVRHV
jgi:hypothetical protein